MQEIPDMPAQYLGYHQGAMARIELVRDIIDWYCPLSDRQARALYWRLQNLSWDDLCEVYDRWAYVNS